eukprot:jgi/Botrbrau1/11496/Bobra.0360s0017.2
MKCCLEGWEDGVPVKSWLKELDRGQAQAAERVTVELAPGMNVLIHQKPQLLKGKLGVGACIWDGALVLAEYISGLAIESIGGSRCVELGSGVGLVGLVMARLGAQVVLSDKPSMLSILKSNIAKNWLAPGSYRPGDCCSGTADPCELEWDTPKGLATAMDLARTPVDWVLMSDCVYVNPTTGEATPSQALMDVASALSSPMTTCLLAFEARSTELKVLVRETAYNRFEDIELVDTSSQTFQGPHIEIYRLKNPKK